MRNTCFACGEQRQPKRLAYDVKTFKTYCCNEFICKQPEKLPKNLYNLSEEVIAQFYSEDMQETLGRILGKVSSVRLAPYLVMHVINVAKENGISNLSEALHFIIDRDYQTQESGIQVPKEENPISLDSEPEEWKQARVEKMVQETIEENKEALEKLTDGTDSDSKNEKAKEVMELLEKLENNESGEDDEFEI